jgi:hypothetical protein
MRKTKFVHLLSVVLVAPSVFAVDGLVLINQSTVLSAGGFPYTISQPGSYKLSGNLTVPAATQGIVISADNVSLDLNGFSIFGPVVCTGSPSTTSCTGSSGVGVRSSKRSVSVENGSVSGMSTGIELLGSGDSRIEKVHADSNAIDGIRISGIVRDSTASHNGQNGILASRGVVSGNVTFGNGLIGIQVQSCPASVVGNTSYDNGISNLSAGAGCVSADNAAP